MECSSNKCEHKSSKSYNKYLFISQCFAKSKLETIPESPSVAPLQPQPKDNGEHLPTLISTTHPPSTHQAPRQPHHQQQQQQQQPPPPPPSQQALFPNIGQFPTLHPFYTTPNATLVSLIPAIDQNGALCMIPPSLITPGSLFTPITNVTTPNINLHPALVATTATTTQQMDVQHNDPQHTQNTHPTHPTHDTHDSHHKRKRNKHKKKKHKKRAARKDKNDDNESPFYKNMEIDRDTDSNYQSIQQIVQEIENKYEKDTLQSIPKPKSKKYSNNLLLRARKVLSHYFYLFPFSVFCIILKSICMRCTFFV